MKPVVKIHCVNVYFGVYLSDTPEFLWYSLLYYVLKLPNTPVVRVDLI